MTVVNIALNRHHEALINELIESGRFRDVSEVLWEGLRLVEENLKKEDSFDLSSSGDARTIEDEGIARHIETLGNRAAKRIGSRKDWGS
jgi:putative addiction module CopG family antidote